MFWILTILKGIFEYLAIINYLSPYTSYNPIIIKGFSDQENLFMSGLNLICFKKNIKFQSALTRNQKNFQGLLFNREISSGILPDNFRDINSSIINPGYLFPFTEGKPGTYF